MKYYWLKILLFFFILSCISEKRFDYVKKLDVEFTGIVSHVKRIDHGFGTVCIDLIDKNYNDYDNELDGYFICKVTNNKAKLIINVNSIKLGDSIVFNPKNSKSYLNFRNGKLVFENRIIFSSYDWGYLRDEANKVNCGGASHDPIKMKEKSKD